MLEQQTTFHVDTVQSAQDAHENMTNQFYDVIICDYEMPEKNGLDFLKELRANGNRVPFIMFTGRGREEIAIDALNSGANCYLNKHGNPEKIYRELAYSIQTTVG